LVDFIEIKDKMVKGIFLERPNRFLALVRLRNHVFPSFLPNPGRMYELFFPGVEVLLKEVIKEHRKTRYDLIGVMHDGELVSVDTRIPNKLVLEALKNKSLKEFKKYDVVKPEWKYGSSRLDFLLSNDFEQCLLEVKSCTLVKGNMALFPDAPTLRGTRHLLELIKAKKQGFRACVFFVIQRINAKVFSPNDETDPDFGKTFREALKKGVEAYAYCSEFVGNKITLRDKIEVNLKD
jgi:sugar fermentation stimulation protein A